MIYIVDHVDLNVSSSGSFIVIQICIYPFFNF
jgi:hypothetical protein